MNLTALLAAAALLAFRLPGQAQTRPKASALATDASTQGPVFPKEERAPAANFTGAVYVHPLVKDNATFNCVSSVSFEPGARSHWHTHPAGQILLVTDGLGYYQEAGQPVRLLRKGDVIRAQPGVKHWHGASPRQALSHIALNVHTEKGVVTWLQPVTDQEYNSYK
ncbi:(R)-mandelonitrile lyase [Hymenobacter ruricola]|uniref:Cupin domain-containing protein n=1 Tax=Hymenobacter ruricola TaxID=2791023 RepID=A0ABS0I109_9BACT|nr:cupin domain-containing protein [Hymenobacter ruricola]MBF9220632.1 cupin domain-containing protein [Hymenobacter ruricola]